MATHDHASGAKPQPHEQVSAEGFDHGQAFARFVIDCERRLYLAGRQLFEKLLDKRKALFDFSDADPNPRIDIAGVEHWHLKRQHVVWSISERTPCIEFPPRS